MPLPGAGLRRNLVIAARPDDGSVIAATLQQASISALRAHCMPEINRLLPEIGKNLTLAE
jgi:hypothetical protein